MHGRNHLPGGSDPIPLYGDPDFGYGIYVNRGGTDKITVPGDGTNTVVGFNSEFITHGTTVTEYGAQDGFVMTRGMYYIFGNAHWGSSDVGYEKTMIFGSLIFSYVDGVVVLDGENGDTIPDNSSGYTNSRSILYRHQNPTSPTQVVQLLVSQVSGVDKVLQQGVLAVMRVSLPE